MKGAWSACIVLLSLMPAAVSAQSGPFPNKRIEIVVPGSPGGGQDLTARAIEATLRETRLISQPMIVNNIAGAAGNLAKAYINRHKGDAHFFYTDTNRIYLNKIVGTTPLGIEDVTPLARLTAENLVWVVRADSPLRSAQEILDKVKADPAAVSFGIGTAVGNDLLHILRPAIAVGADPRKMRVVAFKSGGDLMIQLLGGHVTVISTGLSEAVEQVRSGQARLLAVSAHERLSGEFAGVPNWRSMGINVSIRHWRGAFAPPGLSPDMVRFWDETLGRMVKTDAWKKTLEKYGWEDAYADSATFRKDLEQERAIAAPILAQLGMVKDAKQ